MGTVKPLDKKLLLEWIPKVKKIVTVEENVLSGGFGSSILEFASENFPENYLSFEVNSIRLDIHSRFPSSGPKGESSFILGLLCCGDRF